MFKTKGPIRTRVMAVIEDRIDKAEQEYLNQCFDIDVDAEAQIREIQDAAEAKKSDLATSIVTGILGKVL